MESSPLHHMMLDQEGSQLITPNVEALQSRIYVREIHMDMPLHMSNPHEAPHLYLSLPFNHLPFRHIVHNASQVVRVQQLLLNDDL